MVVVIDRSIDRSIAPGLSRFFYVVNSLYFKNFDGTQLLKISRSIVCGNKRESRGLEIQTKSDAVSKQLTKNSSKKAETSKLESTTQLFSVKEQN